MAVWNGFPLIVLPSAVTPNGEPGAPRSVEWQFSDVISSSLNPFSLSQQFYNWGQGLIEMSVSYPPLARSVQPPWEAFLASAQGTLAVFLMVVDPLHVAPQNSGATAPTVSGTNPSGAIVLNISGGSNQTVGDWIGLAGSGAYSTGSRIYMITSVAGGQLGIYPPIREAPTGGQAVIINNAQGIFRMSSPVRKFSIDMQRTVSLVFECREAL